MTPRMASRTLLLLKLLSRLFLRLFPSRQNLMTKKLRKTYGGIRGEVFVHDLDEEVRMIGVFTKTRKRKCVMVAITELNTHAWNADMVAIDKELAEGGLMGETVAKRKLKWKRIVLGVLTWEISEKVRKKVQSVLGTDSTEVYVRWVRFTIQRPGEEPVPYGDVFEIFPNDVMPPGPEPGLILVTKNLTNEILNDFLGKKTAPHTLELVRVPPTPYAA
jgi:hypothetical protein